MVDYLTNGGCLKSFSLKLIISRAYTMSLYDTVLTNEFCEKWKYLLKKLYSYKFNEEFAIVPSLMRGSVLSYLPLLNYTDVNIIEADRLMSRVSGQDFQIRVLNPVYQDFKKNDTITMRIDLKKRSIDEIFSAISKRTRRYFTNEVGKYNFALEVGSSKKHITDFYHIFTDVMYRLGTPAFSYRLFELLPDIFDAKYYVVYKDNKIASAAVIINDTEISWVPWSGTATKFLELRPGLVMYWEAIKDAYQGGKLIFDFGRSGYDSGTFEFKCRWGAIPVKIDILGQENNQPYEKYRFASAIWARSPRQLVNFTGPHLCKYLADL